MKSEQSKTGYYFLFVVIIISIIIFVFKPELIFPALDNLLDLLKKIIPILLLVFFIMFVVNYFVTTKGVVKYLSKKSKKKGWLIAIISGIISTGPIYLWYPLLSELQDKGVRSAYIAAFLYNRAVKPALLPLMIFYFGIKFTLILTVVMILASIVQGIVVEKIVEVKI